MPSFYYRKAIVIIGLLAVVIVIAVTLSVLAQSVLHVVGQRTATLSQTSSPISQPTLSFPPVLANLKTLNRFSSNATSNTINFDYGCPSGPCPKSLEFAVNGCDCAGELYESDYNSALYCCADGFSDEECAESLAKEARLEELYGFDEDTIKARLVEVELQGWTILVNQDIAPAIERVNEKLQYVDYEIFEAPQCWSWRVVAGHQVMSLHAFAIAIDINPSSNPSCGPTAICECYNDLITDMPPEFVEAFTSEGFEWGGDWVDHPDPMHFEWTGWR